MTYTTTYLSGSDIRQTGGVGENFACEHLQKHGFKLLDRNVTSRWGEIDIVAERKNKLHFIEVKTRIQTKQGMPYESVRINKLFHLMRTIQHYIMMHHYYHYKCQVDVISVVLNRDKTLHSLKTYENIEVDRFI